MESSINKPVVIMDFVRGVGVIALCGVGIVLVATMVLAVLRVTFHEARDFWIWGIQW